MTEKLQSIADSPVLDIIFKAVVVCLLPWGIFVTNEVFEARAFQNKGDRFSDRDGLEMEKSLIQIIHAAETRIDNRIDRLPPDEWRAQIRQALADSRKVETMIRDLEKEFSRDFVRWSELPKELQP